MIIEKVRIRVDCLIGRLLHWLAPRSRAHLPYSAGNDEGRVGKF